MNKIIYKVVLREKNSKDTIWCEVYVSASSVIEAAQKAEKKEQLPSGNLIVCNVEETHIDYIG